MNQEGLLFPKEATKKKREKHGKCIMPEDQKGRCYICGSNRGIHRHHIFFGNKNKKWSERYGLTVHLCLKCHKESPTSVHKCQETSLILEQMGQRAFERTYGDRKKFREIFGENYLEEENEFI